MRGRDGNRGRRGATRGLLALLVVAGVWLALLGAVLGGSSHASAAPSLAAISSTPTDTPTPTSALPPLTPTIVKTPQGKPPTPSPSASPSPSPTTQPTATTPPNNGGGGGGGGGDVGPQPTKVVFTQPTAGAGGGGPLGGFSPTTFGSNGLLLATTSSCIVSLLGLLIAAIALTVLLRGGYGPFLRALLHGKRASLVRGTTASAGGGNETAGAAGDARRFGFGPGESFGRTRDGFIGDPRPSRQSGFDYDQYDQRGPRQPGASRPAGRTPPPPGRGSRSNW